jgi:hypothetical protein
VNRAKQFDASAIVAMQPIVNAAHEHAIATGRANQQFFMF